MNLKTQFSSHINVLASRTQVINCVFTHCYDSNHGGAIFVNSLPAIFICLMSAFSNCRSDGYGGAICVFYSNHSRFRSNCFDMCSGLSASILIWGHFQSNNYVEFNLSHEYYITQSHSSCILGTTSALVLHNNFSRSQYSSHVAGFTIGTGIEQTAMDFCQVANAIGKFFFSVQNSKTGVNPCLSRINFVNVTATQSFLFFAHYSTNPLFANCLFLINSQVGLVSYQNCNGNPQFICCAFSIPFDSTLYSSIQTPSNIFNVSNLQYHTFPTLDTYNCWNDNLFISTKNYQHYSHKVLLEFAILELIPIVMI